MESFSLEPQYSTNEIAGKCIHCLAEQELHTCLRHLLLDENENPEVKQKYEALVTFLLSPELKKLRAESERYLADGKKVTVTVQIVEGQTEYKLNVNDDDPKPASSDDK